VLQKECLKSGKRRADRTASNVESRDTLLVIALASTAANSLLSTRVGIRGIVLNAVLRNILHASAETEVILVVPQIEEALLVFAIIVESRDILLVIVLPTVMETVFVVESPVTLRETVLKNQRRNPINKTATSAEKRAILLVIATLSNDVPNPIAASISVK
jgi:hypothetical protein